MSIYTITKPTTNTISHAVLLGLYRLCRATLISCLISSLAIIYAETLYQATRVLYMLGYLKRYYPLPVDRNLLINFGNAFGFILPSVLYILRDPSGSWSWKLPSFPALALSMAGYMITHDVLFYFSHRLFHYNKSLYRALHEMHHDYTHEMNVYVVGYAEIVENFLQVGIPWLLWTIVISALGPKQILLLAIPYSLTLYTTLLGHSGYKFHVTLLLFHPMIFPVLLITGPRGMLTIGDHQVHHGLRVYNFGLFFRFWDRRFHTYKRCEYKAYDVNHWKNIIASGSHKQVGKKNFVVDFAEIASAWGF